MPLDLVTMRMEHIEHIELVLHSVCDGFNSNTFYQDALQCECIAHRIEKRRRVLPHDAQRRVGPPLIVDIDVNGIQYG